MDFTQCRQLSLYVALLKWRNRVNALSYMDLSNRRTGKDATNPRTPGLFDNIVEPSLDLILLWYVLWKQTDYWT